MRNSQIIELFIIAIIFVFWISTALMLYVPIYNLHHCINCNRNVSGKKVLESAASGKKVFSPDAAKEKSE